LEERLPQLDLLFGVAHGRGLEGFEGGFFLGAHWWRRGIQTQRGDIRGLGFVAGLRRRLALAALGALRHGNATRAQQ